LNQEPLFSMAITYKSIHTRASNADVQRKNNFLIRFFSADNSSNITDDFILYIDSFPFPKQSNSIRETASVNFSAKYAGAFESTENISVKFREYLDRNTSHMLSVWRSRCAHQATGCVLLPNQYYIQGELLKLSPTGNIEEEGTQTWALKNCWLADYKEEDYDNSDDGSLVTVSCTLVIERVVLKSTKTSPPEQAKQ